MKKIEQYINLRLYLNCLGIFMSIVSLIFLVMQINENIESGKYWAKYIAIILCLQFSLIMFYLGNSKNHLLKDNPTCTPRTLYWLSIAIITMGVLGIIDSVTVYNLIEALKLDAIFVGTIIVFFKLMRDYRAEMKEAANPCED